MAQQAQRWRRLLATLGPLRLPPGRWLRAAGPQQLPARGVVALRVQGPPWCRHALCPACPCGPLVALPARRPVGGRAVAAPCVRVVPTCSSQVLHGRAKPAAHLGAGAPHRVGLGLSGFSNRRQGVSGELCPSGVRYAMAAGGSAPNQTEQLPCRDAFCAHCGVEIRAHITSRGLRERSTARPQALSHRRPLFVWTGVFRLCGQAPAQLPRTQPVHGEHRGCTAACAQPATVTELIGPD